MKQARLALLAFWIIAGLLLAACSGGTPEPTLQTGGSSGDQASPTPVLSVKDRVPEDIPLPAGATNLLVDSRGRTFTFSVALPLPDLMDFYIAELTASGWETAGGSEAVIGQTATVLRRKGADRVTVTMNGNPNTAEVFVQINLSR